MIIERDHLIDIPIYSVTSKSTTGTQIQKRYLWITFVCGKMAVAPEQGGLGGGGTVRCAARKVKNRFFGFFAFFGS